MKFHAIGMLRHGGPEVFEAVETSLPDVPPAGHVRVRVASVALNHLDLWFRRGLPHLKVTMPHVLGSDVAGTIEAVGEGARSAPVGTAAVLAPGISCGVCEPCQFGEDNQCREFRILGEFVPGGYGDVVDVPAANVFPIPSGLSMTDAAAVPLTFLTAWALVEKANVQLGERVLVHAIGSGVSTAVAQLVRARGGRVIGTTSSTAKVARANELGVEDVVDTSKEDFVEGVKRLTAKRGVEVAIDHVGGEVFSKTLATLATAGRLVTCGATAGTAPSFDLTRTYMRYNTIQGTRMGARKYLFPILRAVAAGTLKPVVHAVLPRTVDGAKEAHRALEAREAFGKIVLGAS